MIAFCLAAGVAWSDGRTCPDIDVLPACKYEDSQDCYWHGVMHGNGRGRSFVDIDGLLFAWDGVVLATPAKRRVYVVKRKPWWRIKP